MVRSLVIAGLAQEVKKEDLPFLVNWAGPEVKPMEVNDKEGTQALVEIIRGLGDMQPKIKGKVKNAQRLIIIDTVKVWECVSLLNLVGF